MSQPASSALQPRNLLDILDELIDLPASEQSRRLGELELPPGERSQLQKWLNASPSASTIPLSTPREVLELLGQAHEPVAGSQREAAPAQRGTGVSSSTSQTEGPGSRIGRYELLYQVGEGSTGAVFAAKESDLADAPKVAIKIIGPLFDAGRVIQRFESNSRLLATLDHPGIARVLESGVTESGQAFFVSQWVNGLPITDFCDVQSLSPRNRLELFQSVCQAVEHAHRSRLYHGAIKPSNVLVEVRDHKPTPVITDFGIVSSAGMADVRRKLFVKYGIWPDDLSYTPPEQITRDRFTADTTDDIYSLGALLYELLAGCAPLNERRLRAELYEQLCRTIQQSQIRSPSHRLANAAKALAEKGEHADAKDAANLSRLLRGQLDGLVMRCLEKRPGRRYPSAAELGGNLQQYLRGRKPSILRLFLQAARARFTLTR